MLYHLTLKSANAKTGPIPVSTSSAATCPTACPLQANGCYAAGGPLAIHWRAVTEGKRGMEWSAFLDSVRAMPAGQFWRHNQAGDLPGIGNALDTDALAELAHANIGRRGFTYTHKPLETQRERDAVANANAAGFTVNLSANTLAHADALAALDCGPVAVVLDVPEGTREGCATPEGRPVRICPATYRDDVSCDTCRACGNADRKVIIGFPLHGAGAKKAAAVIRIYRGA